MVSCFWGDIMTGYKKQTIKAKKTSSTIHPIEEKKVTRINFDYPSTRTRKPKPPVKPQQDK